MVDRWVYGTSTAAKGTWGRNLNTTASAAGFPYYLGFQSSSAYASVAGDYFYLGQRIEADMVSDFAWGTANAQPVTLSFWAQSNLGGNFSGALNSAARSYPFTFNLPGTATWTKCVITVPGDTTGAWTLSGNGLGLLVCFDLGAGSTFRGPANAWASSNFIGVTGTDSVVANNFGFLYVTGVKLEIGSVATPFNRKSLAESLADCQRYYSIMDFWLFAGNPTVGASFGQTVTLPTTMRALPTLAFINVTYTNANVMAVGRPSSVSPGIYSSATAANSATAQGVMTASAEL